MKVNWRAPNLEAIEKGALRGGAFKWAIKKKHEMARHPTTRGGGRLKKLKKIRK